MSYLGCSKKNLSKTLMFKMPHDCESDKKHSNFEQPNIHIVTKPIFT